MMFKFKLGQEVIFKNQANNYRFGIIIDRHSTYFGVPIEAYTVESGNNTYYVKKENIQEYTKPLEAQRISKNILMNEDGTLKCDSAVVGESKKAEPRKVKSWDFAMDIFKQAKDQKPIDTTTKFQDGYVDALGYIIKSFWINESVIGLPHGVHFKEKKNRTTLVWKRGDNYSTTTSEAHEEKFDRLYGFLMAYFKKVHQYESKTWRKKYLEKNVYPLKHKEQKHFLTTIFAQNCGLSTEEVYKYLNEIVKDKE